MRTLTGTVVVYANTSAAVKRVRTGVVTSSIAVELIEHLDSLGKKLSGRRTDTGNYVAKQTGADVLCWQGRVSCMTVLKQALTHV